MKELETLIFLGGGGFFLKKDSILKIDFFVGCAGSDHEI